MPTHIVKYSSKMAFDNTMYFIIKNSNFAGKNPLHPLKVQAL